MVLHYTCIMKILLACLALLPALPAWADTCKYEDADGRVIYSNMPMKGAKKIACFGLDGSASQGGARSSSRPRASQTPTPSDFPRVDAGTQRARDDTRRQILTEELAVEQKALEQAKKDYADGKTMQNIAKFEGKMKALQDAVDLHEKNIQMLQKELANTR